MALISPWSDEETAEGIRDEGHQHDSEERFSGPPRRASRKYPPIVAGGQALLL